ncbi:MAG: outer membrane protein assembly factor, partial [Methylotenera sp.]|nr:outer membrane protein assembly factor [Methylotenera sp.]
MNYRLLVYLSLLLWGVIAYADESQHLPKQRYQVEIEAPAPLKSLLQQHLEIIKLRDNPRMTPVEWQRLALSAPQNIKDLLATEGFFSPIITPLLTTQNNVSIATFTVEPGAPVLIQQVALKFTGDIMQQSSKDLPDIQKLQDDWLLKSGMQFRQEDWRQAKRSLLTALLIQRYPNASISKSSATVDVKSNTAALMVEIDSGSAVHFGSLSIEGLKRYPDSIIKNLNPIKTGSVYSQSQLLTFQSRLQESRYFRSVEVTADTKTANADGSPVT